MKFYMLQSLFFKTCLLVKNIKSKFCISKFTSFIFLCLTSIVIYTLSSTSISALEKNKKYDFYGKDGQNFKGAIFIREEKKAFIIRMYFSDQEIRIYKKDLIKKPKVSDSIAPVVSIKPKAGTTLNTLTKIKLTFSEPVLLANHLENYKLGGSGRNKLSIISVKKINSKKYMLKISGKAGNGKVILILKNIVDKAGNTLEQNEFFFELDTLAPELESIPANHTRTRKLKNIELKFSKAMKGLSRKSNYSLAGVAGAGLKIESVLKLSDSSVRIKLQGKAKDGKLKLNWKNLIDKVGNSPKSSGVSFTIGPPLEDLMPGWNDKKSSNKKSSFFKNHLIALHGSFSVLNGTYSNYFPHAFAGGLRWEYTMKTPYSYVSALNRNPLAPGSLLTLEAFYFSGKKRSMSGTIPALGPIWYFPFFPEKSARLALSFSYGFTFLKINARTFTGKLYTNYFSTELQYQYVLNPFLFGLFVRQIVILDSRGSIFQKSFGIEFGYVF